VVRVLLLQVRHLLANFAGPMAGGAAAAAAASLSADDFDDDAAGEGPDEDLLAELERQI
jgi:hypothetical protein